MKELNMPYDIKVLTKIRHECFRQKLGIQAKKCESNAVVQSTKSMKTCKAGRQRMTKPRPSCTRQLRTRAAIRAHTTKTSATVTQQRTAVQLDRPILPAITQSDYQLMPISTTSSTPSPRLVIASPSPQPSLTDLQTISEPLTMTTMATTSESNVIYQVECMDLDNNEPFYLVSTDPITVEIAPDNTAVQVNGSGHNGGYATELNEVNGVSEFFCFVYCFSSLIRFYLKANSAILHSIIFIHCRICMFYCSFAIETLCVYLSV